MKEIPCKNCITLPICRSDIRGNGNETNMKKALIIVKVSDCSLLLNYISYIDGERKYWHRLCDEAFHIILKRFFLVSEIMN